MNELREQIMPQESKADTFASEIINALRSDFSEEERHIFLIRINDFVRNENESSIKEMIWKSEELQVRAKQLSELKFI